MFCPSSWGPAPRTSCVSGVYPITADARLSFLAIKRVVERGNRTLACWTVPYGGRRVGCKELCKEKVELRRAALSSGGQWERSRDAPRMFQPFVSSQSEVTSRVEWHSKPLKRPKVQADGKCPTLLLQESFSGPKTWVVVGRLPRFAGSKTGGRSDFRRWMGRLTDVSWAFSSFFEDL